MSALSPHEIWLEALKLSYDPRPSNLFRTAPRVKGKVTNDGKEWEFSVTCWTLGLGFVLGPPDRFSENNRTMYFALDRVKKQLDSRTNQLYTEVIQLACAATIVVRNMRLAGCTFMHKELAKAMISPAHLVLHLTSPPPPRVSELLACAWGMRRNELGRTMTTRPIYGIRLLKLVRDELKHPDEVASFTYKLLDHRAERIVELCLLRMMDVCVEFKNLPAIKTPLMFWSGDMKTGAQSDVHKAFPVENEIQTMWSSFAEALSLIITEPQSDEKQAASSSSAMAAVTDAASGVASMQLGATAVQLSRVRKNNDAKTDGRGSYKRPRTDAVLQAAHAARPADVLEELKLLQTTRHVERGLFRMILDYADDFSLAEPLPDAKVTFHRFALSDFETQAFASNRAGRLAAVFFERGEPRTIKVFEKGDYRRPRYVCDISRMHKGVAQPPKVKPVRNGDESSSESESDYDYEYDPRVSRIHGLHVTESGLVLFLAESYDTLFRFGLWDVEAQKVIMLMESERGTHIGFAHKPYALSSMINASAPSLTAVAIEVPRSHEIHVFTYDNLRHTLVENSNVVLPNLHEGAEEKALHPNTYVEYFMSNGGDVFRRIDDMLFVDAAGTQTVSQLSLAPFAQPGEPLLCCFANGPSDDYVLMSLQTRPNSLNSRTQLWTLKKQREHGAFAAVNRIELPNIDRREPLRSISLVPNERVVFAFGWHLYEMKIEQPPSEAAASSSSSAAAAMAVEYKEPHPDTVQDELLDLCNTTHVETALFSMIEDYSYGCPFEKADTKTNKLVFEESKISWHKRVQFVGANLAGQLALIVRRNNPMSYYLVFADADTLGTADIKKLKHLAMPRGRATAVHMSKSGVAIVAHRESDIHGAELYFFHPGDEKAPPKAKVGLTDGAGGRGSDITDICSIFNPDTAIMQVAAHYRHSSNLLKFDYDTSNRTITPLFAYALRGCGNSFGPVFVTETGMYARSGNRNLQYCAQLSDIQTPNAMVSVNTHRCEPDEDIALLTNAADDTVMFMVVYNKAIHNGGSHELRGGYSLYIVSRVTGEVVNRLFSDPITEAFKSLTYAGAMNLYCVKKWGGLVRVTLQRR